MLWQARAETRASVHIVPKSGQHQPPPNSLHEDAGEGLGGGCTPEADTVHCETVTTLEAVCLCSRCWCQGQS